MTSYLHPARWRNHPALTYSVVACVFSAVVLLGAWATMATMLRWQWQETLSAEMRQNTNTAVALHRNISRSTIYGDLRLVCLYGEDPVADELQHNVTLLSRQAPDEDLRAALTNAHSSATPDTLRFQERIKGKDCAHQSRRTKPQYNPSIAKSASFGTSIGA